MSGISSPTGLSQTTGLSVKDATEIMSLFEGFIEASKAAAKDEDNKSAEDNKDSGQ
jgi:hypothetical protein